MSGLPSPAVLVGCHDLTLLDEVIRYLEEIPQWRLGVPARSAEEVVRGLELHSADVALISDVIALDLAEDGLAEDLGSVVVFAREESTEVLRACLKLGARGFVLWPKERFQLQHLVEGSLRMEAAAPSGAGVTHAVWAPKGGAGASVIAAHLAASLAKMHKECLLVDLDLDHADQTRILKAESETKTILDLLRVGDELSASMVRSIAWTHPEGFRALLSPGTHGSGALVKPADIARVLRTVREAADHVVADVPSTLSELALSILYEANSVVVVLTPDLLGLRRAREAVKTLRASGIDGSRIHAVLNQAGGVDVSHKDVEQVLEVGRATRVGADFQIYRSTNKGELSGACSRMIAPLARRLGGIQASGDSIPAPDVRQTPRSRRLLAGQRS